MLLLHLEKCSFMVVLELDGSICCSNPRTLIGHMITLMFKIAAEFLCLCDFILRRRNISFPTTVLFITSITSKINKY